MKNETPKDYTLAIAIGLILASLAWHWLAV